MLVALGVLLVLLRDRTTRGALTQSDDEVGFVGGDWNAPAVGVLLGPEPVPFVQRLTEESPLTEGASALEPDEVGYFSRDWRAMVVARTDTVVERTETQEEVERVVTRVHLPWEEEPFTLQGEYGFRPLGPEAVIAVPIRPSTRREFTVQLLRPRTVSSYSTRQPTWVAGTASGALVAIGTLSEARVFGATEEPLLEVPGNTSIGALTEQWLALEQELDGKNELCLQALSGDTPFRVGVQPGIELRFDPLGKVLAHVAGNALTVLDLIEPHRVERLQPPTGARWRSCAFDPSGRLAAGWIHVESPLESKGAERPQGRAHLGFELFRTESWPPAREEPSKQWSVSHWDNRTPELSFDARGHLFAQAWPASFEVLP